MGDLGHELRKLRRPQDKFAYESVFVDSFEDAILAVILNGSFEAVVIYDDVPFASVTIIPSCESSWPPIAAQAVSIQGLFNRASRWRKQSSLYGRN